MSPANRRARLLLGAGAAAAVVLVALVVLDERPGRRRVDEPGPAPASAPRTDAALRPVDGGSVGAVESSADPAREPLALDPAAAEPRPAPPPPAPAAADDVVVRGALLAPDGLPLAWSPLVLRTLRASTRDAVGYVAGRTDGDGGFRVEVDGAGLTAVLVQAWAPSCADVRELRYVEEGVDEVDFGTLVFEPGGTVFGQLVVEEGSGPPDWRGWRVFAREPPLEQAELWSGFERSAAVDPATGAFELSGIRSGPAELFASHGALGPQPGLRVHVVNGGAVEVRLAVADVDPRGCLRLVFRGPRVPAEIRVVGGGEERRFDSPAQGEDFVACGLPPGSYEVSVLAADGCAWGKTMWTGASALVELMDPSTGCALGETSR